MKASDSVSPIYQFNVFSVFKPGLFLPPDTGGSCYVITIETGHGQTRAVEVECGNA